MHLMHRKFKWSISHNSMGRTLIGIYYITIPYSRPLSSNGVLGAVTHTLDEWLQHIPGTTCKVSIQKCAVLQTAKILSLKLAFLFILFNIILYWIWWYMHQYLNSGVRIVFMDLALHKAASKECEQRLKDNFHIQTVPADSMQLCNIQSNEVNQKLQLRWAKWWLHNSRQSLKLIK